MDKYHIAVFYDSKIFVHDLELEQTISEDIAILICKGVLYDNDWNQVSFCISKNGQRFYVECEEGNQEELEELDKYFATKE